jgi:hypothetical protein
MSEATISMYLRNMMMRQFFQISPTPPQEAVYFALTRSVPVANSTGANLDEPQGGGYARAGYLVDAEHWEVTDYAQAYNLLPVVFGQATADWGFCQGYAIATESTGGDTLAVGRLTTSMFIAAGTIPAIGPGVAYLALTD